MFDPMNPAPPGRDDQTVAREILACRHDTFSRIEISSSALPGHGDEFTEPFTTIPVITGPVIVFNSVKNFCSSLSLAFAT